MSVNNLKNHQYLYPGIDYDIGVGNVLDDDELYREILVMFYEDHAEDADKIEQAITTSNKENAKRLIHTLKGVASSIGAIVLFEHAKLLDTAINEERVDDYLILFNNLKPELNNVITGIKFAVIDK